MILLNIYIILLCVAITCYILMETSIMEKILKFLFGELDENACDEFHDSLKEKYPHCCEEEYDESMDTIMTLSVILFPPFYICVFVMFIWLYIKFGKREQ